MDSFNVKDREDFKKKKREKKVYFSSLLAEQLPCPVPLAGVSMHALAAMQLTGAAGGMQVDGARLGGIFNMGGTAVANYVSILERIK